MTGLDQTIAKLASRPDGVREAAYAAREEECREGYESQRAAPLKALSRIRSFAMTVPRPRGFDLVLTGRTAEGWRELERWWLLETLTTHLIGPHMASGAQILLGYAMALGEAQAAGWMAVALQSRMKRYPDAYEGQHFPRFLLHLHRVYFPDSDAGPGSIPELGLYSAVFDAWDEPERLEAALADICTLRMQVIAAEPADEVSEFRFAPLLPVEVAAVHRIRAARGEPAISVAHPLMETPLANIPASRTYDPAEDVWYQRAVEAGQTTDRLEADFRWRDPDVRG